MKMIHLLKIATYFFISIIIVQSASLFPSSVNDLQPTLSINDVTLNEGAGIATFTVTLSNPSSFPVTVNYSTADGTATAGSDYTATSGPLTFNPFETAKTISVPAIDDLIYEGDETFYLDLSNPINATIIDDQGTGTIVDNEQHRTVEDVVSAFDALTHQGEWLGFHMGPAPNTYPCPTEEHIQGIARSPHTGKPIFYVTRSGNVHDPDYLGSLMVVEMGTRDTDGERLRSNRLLKGEETRTTPPHTLDRVILNIPYSDWEHAGGIQMVGDILAVPLETPDNIYLPQGRIIFYDCSNPGNPQKLSYELDFPGHKVGVLGISRLPGGHYFMIVTWGDNDTVQFYRSNETSFFAPDFQFESHPVSPDSFLNLIYNFYWPVGSSRDDYAFQTLNFINQTDGQLFLIASRCSDSWAPSSVHHGDDLMYLIQVTGFGQGETVEFTGIRKDVHKQLSSEGCWNAWGGMVCSGKSMIVSENIQANFNAGAGAYVSPTGELLYYATSHYNKGPYGTVKMAELRHNFVSSSGTSGPQFEDNHLGGPYSIAEGASITLNGEPFYSGHSMMPWVQMFADSNFQGPMVMMDLYDQFSDDYNDFSKLDGCLTPAPDGFNDQLSSFRFFGPPGSVLMLLDDNNYRIGNTYYPPVWGTGEVVEIPFVGWHFNDEATSALLLWNGYSSEPYSWDLDNDGEYDASGPTATFHAGSGSSTNIIRMKYVYSDAWIFTGLGVPMSFPETYAIFETTINVHEVTLSVDAGPDAIVNEGETFTGSGSFTDEDEDTWTATVDYGDGSGVQPLALDSTNKTFTFDHVYADDGVYTVTVTVTDKEGEVGTDVVTVTVTDFGPTAALTGDTVFDEGSPGSYDASGSASSPDAIVLYEWDWNYDGTTFNPSGDTGAVQIHAWMDNDTYTAAVRVTDDDGSTDIAVLEVTIIDFAPTAAFTWAPEPQDEGSSVSFTDTSTSVSDLITAWSWDFGGLGTGNEQNPNFTFNDDGTFTVTLTVTDDDGSTSTVSHDVTINNVAPAIVAGDDMAANEGEMLNFEGSFVDPGTADTHTFQWDFGDGASASGSLTPTHAYGDNGAYTVTLTVTDDDGGVGFDNLIVTVSNVPPMVEAGPDQAGESCVHEISLSGFFTDPGWLDTHTATIDWGDGTIEPGLVTEENNPPDSTGNLTGSHKYIIPGIYTVTLVVTDDDGDTGIDTLTVTATDTIAPDINLISPEATTYLNTQEPIPIDYTVTDMCDPDPEMKFYLDGEEFTEDSIHLGIYLGESEHTLRVEATDSSGNVGEVSVTFTVVPEQMKSILIKHMKIRWELPHWGKCWGWGNKTTFMIHGRLELPDEYKSADLDKSAFLNILIADKEGKDKVIFKEKKKLWRYHEPSRWKNRVDDSLDQGIDIKSMIIHWQSEKESKYWWFNTKCKHSWFYVRGELSLEGINIKTLPKEATVTLEIPVAPSGEAGSLVAEETIKFKKFWHIWFYHTWNKWGGWKDGWWKKWDRD